MNIGLYFLKNNLSKINSFSTTFCKWVFFRPSKAMSYIRKRKRRSKCVKKIYWTCCALFRDDFFFKLTFSFSFLNIFCQIFQYSNKQKTWKKTRKIKHMFLFLTRCLDKSELTMEVFWLEVSIGIWLTIF